MEEAIIVFPEGVRGSGKKLFKIDIKLQRFGSGFMHLAMKHKTPIIPVGIVGCEESIISIADIKPLAKLLECLMHLLIFPAVLPTKVYLHFGKPMYFNPKTKDYRETEANQNVIIVKEEIKI
ncbi:MAG: 1-acyl-sn-glycerol-3-phosphate acyltransferase [Bacteroidetes bacterium]|nr:1-acyl-sn-glycerol-3-phosphate acyltransferase [Bacteroidota bacterium]